MIGKKPRIAILSSRERSNFVCNSCLYEFEDIIVEVDDVDLINLPPSEIGQKVRQRILRETAQYIPAFTKFSPSLTQNIDLDREYDLLFIILDFPWHIFHINLLKHWRAKSKVTVCYLIELWENDISRFYNYVKFLQDFDFIFLGHSQIVDRVQDITGKPCNYLAPGIDALKFCPESGDRNRSIDLCTMGRRSPITHQALLKLAEKQDFFYHYDPLRSSERRIKNHQAHRIFNANILKNSRYFIANQAKFDCVERTGGQVEIGYRFFEGAAAGTVMLGKRPKTNIFEQYFGWENSLIEMEYDEPSIDKIITKLDNNPALLNEIRHNNIKHSLLQHDWVYRWQQVLDKTGFAPHDKSIQRRNHLQRLAGDFELKPMH